MIGPVIEPVTEPMIEKVRSMWPYKSAESIGLLRAEYLDLDALLDDLTHEVVCRRGRLVQRKIEPAKRKVALAISGGGAAGAYSAGVIEALLGRLRERGIGVDLLVGTSSGALNGFGVLVEELGKANPQLSEDPDLRQPYTSFIASMWSYLDRHGRTSMWIAGRRAWIVDLATRGITTPLKRWGLVTLLALLVLLLNPFLLVSLSGLAGVGRFVPELLLRWGFTGDHPIHFAVLGAVSLLMLAAFLLWVVRAFRFSLIRELPLLRLLANTGPQGDLSTLWFWSREKTVDRARVLSRELVKAWYDAAQPPELIVAATDISLGGECLFTLVRPDTYRRLAEANWTAVQLDSPDDAARPYREQKHALFTLPENFLHCILSSTAVPGAFPAQQLGIYGVDGRRDVRHYFVDGGVLNNSPIHIAIDAGATHVISLELEPLGSVGALDVDDRGKVYNLFETGIATFSTLLGLSTQEDVRRSVAWNRFLSRHPEALERGGGQETPGSGLADSAPALRKRLVPMYRIAPRKREIGTVEFDGRFERRRRTVTLRDWLRRGLVDLQGPNIWRATLQADPPRDGGAETEVS